MKILRGFLVLTLSALAVLALLGALNPRVTVQAKPGLSALTIAVNLFGFCVQDSSAYPVFAQQNYSNPRAANGKLACANCHLNQKAIEIESPQAVLPNTVFEVEIKVPYDLNSQQIGANGQKTDLNVGGILILPKVLK